MSQYYINVELQNLLTEIQIDQPLLIDKEISVERKFSILLSFRRGATTRSNEMNLGKENIATNNISIKFENRSGSMTNLHMSELYMEIKQSLLTRLHFSLCL